MSPQERYTAALIASGRMLCTRPTKSRPRPSSLSRFVVISLVVGFGVVVLAVVLGSEKRTEQAGRLIEPVWSRVLRLLRKQCLLFATEQRHGRVDCAAATAASLQ